MLVNLRISQVERGNTSSVVPVRQWGTACKVVRNPRRSCARGPVTTRWDHDMEATEHGPLLLCSHSPCHAVPAFTRRVTYLLVSKWLVRSHRLVKNAFGHFRENARANSSPTKIFFLWCQKMFLNIETKHFFSFLATRFFSCDKNFFLPARKTFLSHKKNLAIRRKKNLFCH